MRLRFFFFLLSCTCGKIYLFSSIRKCNVAEFDIIICHVGLVTISLMTQSASLDKTKTSVSVLLSTPELNNCNSSSSVCTQEHQEHADEVILLINGVPDIDTATSVTISVVTSSSGSCCCSDRRSGYRNNMQ